jgi:hypothetical protein
MKNKSTQFNVALTAVCLALTSCGTKHVVYNPSTGEYIEGRAAKQIIEQEEKLLEARNQSRDREFERNIKRREASRKVTRETLMFGHTVDEFDVLAARERALEAEADAARIAVENAEAASRAHKIVDYEKRFERAMTRIDRIEVIPEVN